MTDIAIRVENCILSRVEGCILSGVEGCILSGVEGCILSRVEGLSKLYTIGVAQQRHDTLRDALVSSLPRISRKRKGNSSNSSHSWQESTDLWALKDVSFEVKQGEGATEQFVVSGSDAV